jgi:hypothetical protein
VVDGTVDETRFGLAQARVLGSQDREEPVDHVGAGRDYHPDRSRTGELPQGGYSVSDPPRLSFIIRRAWLYGLRLAGWTRTRVLAQPEPR